MAIALTSNPLSIASIMRYNGVTTVKVVGHGFTQGAHAGASLRVTDAPDKTYNGTFVISKVIDADTIQYLQSTQNDIHTEMKGGAISVG